jgi:DNA invertase Pin-like site-specific DNA recombinase
MDTMLIGYARVSTSDQNLDLQKDELERVGCKRICTDVASGAKSERPGLTDALAHAREGDTLVVWKLDRVGRSLGHLIETVRLLQERRIGFRSLHENIDTTTSTGKLIFHVFGALAEFERDLIRERTHAGLSAARARGRKGGRRPVLDDKQHLVLRSLAQDRNNSPAVICATLGISRATFYRYASRAPVTTQAAGAPHPAHRSTKAPRARKGSRPATRPPPSARARASTRRSR